MAATQTAALVPLNVRTDRGLGEIVWTESGRWREPDPQALFLPIASLDGGGGATSPDSTVHPELVDSGVPVSIAAPGAQAAVR